MHSLVERRRFSIVFPPPTQGDRISPYYRFHCQRCFVYPSRRSTSSILPNMSPRTALHLPIFRRRPGGLGWWGSDSSATGRVSCMGCRPTHANGDGAVTVAERRLIRSSSSIRVINVFTPSSMHLQRATATVFALLVRNSRRVVGLSIARRCWRRPAALRAHRRRGLQPSRSPLGISLGA